MPIKIPDGLPAAEVLKKERIPVIREMDALRQDIRPLRIALLNLMPDKIATETQIARVLGSTPLQVELTLLRTGSYMGKNTTEEHLLGFYQTWEDIKAQKFDGLVVTGAPVEHMEFEEVQYWDELTSIFEWAKTHTYSQFYICWAAQAALYHFYQIPKRPTQSKQFGVFPHSRLDFYHPLTRGFDDIVYIPVSRHTDVDPEKIEKNIFLAPLITSDKTGISLIYDDQNCSTFMFNHLEYDRETLKKEYERDIAKGLDIPLPAGYFPKDDPEQPPVMNWRAHRNLLFSNWIGMVYQGTPYDLADLAEKNA